MLLKLWPCLGYHPKFYYSSRTNDIMNAILFLSHSLAIAVQKIHIIVFAFVYVEHSKFHQTNQLNRAGSTLFTILEQTCTKFPV